MLGGGFGGGGLFANGASPIGLFHVAGRFGAFFDFGGFTFEVLAGPAAFANKNALGAFESVFEIGGRF